MGRFARQSKAVHRSQKLFRTCIALLLAVTSAAPALADEPVSRLAPLARRLAEEHHVCAVAYATVIAGAARESGGIIAACSGSDAAPEDTVFQAASLGKPVFAYLVLGLARQGKLDLDAALTKYLPGGYRHWRNPFDFAAERKVELVAEPLLEAVTARMVLSHTSGLPNWSSRGPLTFSFAPGSSWQYSGEGYMLLQQVVEAVTGEPLDRLARRLVFEPLGMSSSEYVWPERLASRVVAGQTASGQTRGARFPAPIAAASLYTTAKDYARFLAAVLEDSSLVSQIVAEPVSVSRWLGLEWGLGWGIERTSGKQEEVRLWHWGNNPGYRAFVMAVPSSRNAVVVLTNSEAGMQVALPLVEAALPGDHAAFRFRMVR